MKLVDHFQYGLDSPICLTWELTYACNLACVHCLSSSGRRDPRELTTAECKAVIDELRADAGVLRQHRRRRADRAAGLLGAARLRDRPPRRGEVLHQRDQARPSSGRRSWRPPTTSTCRSRWTARPRRSTTPSAAPAPTPPRCGRWRTWPRPGSASFKISVVMTRHNVGQLDEFKAIADRFGAQLRITRLRPSGRGADVWDELHPLAGAAARAYDWLVAHGDEVLTGDSFFHLSAYGEALPGLNLCGAGRVVCLIDPVGDVYACPFAIHENFLAGNVRVAGRVRRRCGGTRSCSPSCAARRPAARARRARPSTPAGAGAWRRSSSPACRWTGPTRSACAGYGEQALAARSSTRDPALGGRPLPVRTPELADAEGAGAADALGPAACAGSPTGPATRARWPGCAAGAGMIGVRRRELHVAGSAAATSIAGSASGRGPRSAARRCCVPVGSIEQHGPHLPLDTDATDRRRPVAAPAPRRGRTVLVAPPLAYGAVGRARGLRGHGVDRARGAAAAAGGARPVGGAVGRRGVVFVNGHGGNVRDAGRRGDAAAVRGARRGVVPVRARRRRARGPHRDVAGAGPGPRARPARRRSRGTRPRSTSCCPRCARAG